MWSANNFAGGERKFCFISDHIIGDAIIFIVSRDPKNFRKK